MKRENGLRYLWIVFFLIALSGCDEIKITKPMSSGHSEAPFLGLSSIDKTDSTVTLHWLAHPRAASYKVYDVSSGAPALLQTISNPLAVSTTLTGLTPDASYKYRVRMEDTQGTTEENEQDLTVVMEHAPAIPSTFSLKTPATSPNKNKNPLFTVSGVKAGDVVRLYRDSNDCSAGPIASVTVGVGETSVDLQAASNLSAVGTYAYYVDAENSLTHRSACSSGLSYELLPLCPANFIEVPANGALGTSSDFCVAKYEMRNISGVATSQASGAYYVNVNAQQAWDACHALNSESSDSNKLTDTNADGTYALISNPEWMTVARSIEDEASNWVGGVINRGWVAAPFGNPGDSWSHTMAAPQTDANCLYSNAANTCASSGDHRYKRSHSLKNGQEIWDFSGNLAEWTDWLSSDSAFSFGPETCPTGGFPELKDVNCPDLSANSYMPAIATNTSAQNIGRFYGGGAGPGTGAAIRGGAWNYGSDAGIFSLFLDDNGGASNIQIGFRCVYRP